MKRKIFASIILLAMLTAGATGLKSFAAAMIMFTLYMMDICWRHIERLAFVTFLILAMYWTGTVPVDRWLAKWIAAIDAFFGAGGN